MTAGYTIRRELEEIEEKINRLLYAAMKKHGIRIVGINLTNGTSAQTGDQLAHVKLKAEI